MLPYAGILWVALLSRVILAPLLPDLEQALHISHAAAGSLFLVTSAAYTVALLLSGALTARIRHRTVIVLAAVCNSVGLIMLAVTPNLLLAYPGLVFIGAASGFYIPSGLASIYALYRQEHWGKAIGIHELGSNLSFVTAPLLALALSASLGWRGLLLAVSTVGLLLAFLYRRVSSGGEFRGARETVYRRGGLLTSRPFLAMALLFGLMLGAGVGGYSVLPVYLIGERGMNRVSMNTLLSISRLLALSIVFLAGWIGDRVNPRTALAFTIAACGVSTALIGLGRGALLVAAVLVQPLFTAAFFPLAFALLPRLVSPRQRAAASALVIPFGIITGAGVVPQIMGILGERSAFFMGYIGLGTALLAGLFLFPLLRVTGKFAAPPAEPEPRQAPPVP